MPVCYIPCCVANVRTYSAIGYTEPFGFSVVKWHETDAVLDYRLSDSLDFENAVIVRKQKGTTPVVPFQREKLYL